MPGSVTIKESTMGSGETTEFVSAEDDPIREYAYWNTPDNSGVTPRQRKYAEEVGVDATLDVLSALPCLGGSPMDGPCCTAWSCVTCEARRRTQDRIGEGTMKYRKKPVVVEARQVPDEPDPEFETWLGGAFESWLPSAEAIAFHVNKNGNREAVAHTGDWIIAEPDGEGFYPCTADEFERVYEPA